MARIDWTLPLETDEETPRAVACAVPFDEDRYLVTLTDGTPLAVFSDGLGGAAPWFDNMSVRNVRPVRTADEALQRMEAFVRKLGSCSGNEAYIVEAREIVALLPAQPVDPDLIEARRLVADMFRQPGSHDHNRTLSGLRDSGQAVRIARAAIKRGRELASGATA